MNRKNFFFCEKIILKIVIYHNDENKEACYNDLYNESKKRGGDLVKITTVMDNKAGEQKSLTAEHGLSFFVETGKSQILFDFGAGKAAYDNARKLNIGMENINYAIGSHGHYDHAGGYPEFVKEGLRCPLYTGAGYFEEKYARDGVKATYLGCGFDETWMKKQGLEHRICDGFLELEPGCYLVGSFERTHDFEQIPDRFVRRLDDQWIKDDFSDEICMVLDGEEGQTVIVGCSHPGILNILATVQKHFGRPIRAVFGGTHLVEADADRIRVTLDQMKQMGVGLIGFNHCSGEQLQQIMDQETQLKHCYLGAGDCIYL